MFLPKKGLIRLNRSQVDDFAWWRQNRGKHSDTEWPRYILFHSLPENTCVQDHDGDLEKWQSSIRKIKPSKLKKELSFLRAYQADAVSKFLWLHKLGCHGLLADEMGLGKTVQALTFSNLHQT